MTYYIESPTKSFKTLNEQYTINQEIRRESKSTKFESKISITGTDGLSIENEWQPMLSWKAFLNLINETAPTLQENFPLVETSEQRIGRYLLCSAYLLKDGQLIKTFMPKSHTLKEFTGILERKDKMQLSTGEHVLEVKAQDIAAIVNE